MTVEATELTFYWSLPTGPIINIDLPGAAAVVEKLGENYPRANQAAIDKIDELVRKLVEQEVALTKAELLK